MRKDIGTGRHLIELLLAGLIIAGVVTAIIIVDMRATGRARQLHCASNVHQLTLAMQQYADDYDGKLPLGYDWQTLMLAYAARREDPRVTLLTCSARPDNPGYATGLNYDVAGGDSALVGRQVWLAEVRNGSAETWWANDIRYRRLRHNRFPVAPHRERTNVSRGDGSVRARDPYGLKATDWLPFATDQMSPP